MLNARVILLAICACLFFVLVHSDVCAQDKKKDDVLDGVRGLDHPGILVNDLEAAKDTYRDTLGFWIQPRGEASISSGSGMKMSNATFEDGSYLQLMGIDDIEKAKLNRPAYLEFLGKHEGEVPHAQCVFGGRHGQVLEGSRP